MLKLIKYLRPFTVPLLFNIAFMFGMAIAELSLPTLLADMINNGMMLGDTGYVLRKGGHMLAVALMSSSCSIIGSFLSARVALGFGRDLRRYVFTRVSSYSLDEFDKIGTASLITRTTNDITQIQMTFVMMFRFVIYSPIMCVGGIIMARSVDTGLSKILLVIIPIMLLFIAFMAKFIIPLFTVMQKNVDKLNLVLRENLMGIRVIRAFNRQQYEKERFDTANKNLTDVAIRVNKIMACMQPIIMVFMNATTLLIIWFGGLRIAQNNIQIGDMMAFLQYAMQIMFSIIMVTVMFVMIPRAEASAVRVNEVLDLEESIRDTGTTIASETAGSVEFRDVTYRYSGAEQPALKSISFTAKPGEITAIIGGTGAGKSTLINLIPRFYDTESGQVLVDGVDVREQPVESVREKLGFVAQTAVLFSGTVEDNIRYGKDDATPDEIRHAAEISQADSFISEMENGYDSEVSQGGTNLSGGQKQRISIARALIRKPEIYIFDDSFSALDFKTDAKLRAALMEEIGAATQIIVAQRIGTIMGADKIIVLNEGEIVGIGTHKELLAACEVYSEIARSQLSEEELASG
ncbi:MAG: ABC transporter ATP-binding protein/permease [Clostridiales bacterium]|nr:ABC transporter ATP-binding protein/permease [Clostridiales bacterium]